MSSSLYFYKISRITEILPEIIYKDRMDFPYYEVHTENAADWEREVGLLPCRTACLLRDSRI